MGKHQVPTTEFDNEVGGVEATENNKAINSEAKGLSVDEAFDEMVSFLTDDGSMSEADAALVIGKGFSSNDFTEENIHIPGKP